HRARLPSLDPLVTDAGGGGGGAGGCESPGTGAAQAPGLGTGSVRRGAVRLPTRAEPDDTERAGGLRYRADTDSDGVLRARGSGTSVEHHLVGASAAEPGAGDRRHSADDVRRSNEPVPPG